MITLNGKKLDLESNISIKELLESQNYSSEYVVVERNLEIVPREEYEIITICDGDVVEVLHFVGGGSC